VEDTSGDRFTNISVFESPPRHGWSRYVNFEFLNGTCSSFFAIEKITSLKHDKLLLIA
jgi:hypothetical protein